MTKGILITFSICLILMLVIKYTCPKYPRVVQNESGGYAVVVDHNSKWFFGWTYEYYVGSDDYRAFLGDEKIFKTKHEADSVCKIVENYKHQHSYK